LKLWRGDALVDVIDGPLVTAIAEELKFLRATAREVLLEAWLALGNYHKVIVNARAYVADDPLNERLWESQIISLRKLGRHAQAVDCYNRARKTLRDELGVQPGDRLRAAVGHEVQPAKPDRVFGEKIAGRPSRSDARIAV
jgi:SARP family transcriptional regulator, regulator of embCAB operon